jgi:3' exoribonuclease, RNase T-like
MKRIMVDLETLDTKPTTVILSIGAVQFDETQTGMTFYRTCQIDDQITAGRTISGSTIDWWMGQSRVAQEKLFSPAAIASRMQLPNVLKDFGRFVKDADEIWGNGSDFDNSILMDAYRTTMGFLPWSYSKNRCFRTMKKLFPVVEPEFVGTPHQALDDAMHQARWLQEIWRSLKHD